MPFLSSFLHPPTSSPPLPTVEPINVADFVAVHENTSLPVLPPVDTVEYLVKYYDDIPADEKLRVLLTMNLGQTIDLSKDARLLGHIHAGRVMRTRVSLRGKQEYNPEIVRRAECLQLSGIKQPRPTQWKNEKRLSWLQEHPITGIESEWVLTTFMSIMTKLDELAEADAVPGSNIRVSDRYKMRLYEAYFHEDFREEFLRRNDSLSRSGLDARNSATQRVRPYHEIVCDKYNDASWVPSTKSFLFFHHELIETFTLPLKENNVLTYEQAKRLLVDVKGRLNIVSIAHSNILYA